MTRKHVPVMLEESIDCLNCRPGKIYVDGTLGGCGHAMSIIERILPDGLLIGIDQDITAIGNAEKIFRRYSDNVRLFHRNFSDIGAILREMDVGGADGILLDLGISFNQIESSGRGFSFNKDEPLDMRMNPECGVPAKDLVNSLDADALARIFKAYGEERYAWKIARNIVRERDRKLLETSRQLTDIISETIPRKTVGKIHPATRAFMALRIAVNNELEIIDEFMRSFHDYLNTNGRLCVITFHSLEDRIVKHRLKDLEGKCVCPPRFPQCVCQRERIVKIVTAKAIKPTPKEIEINPMARSAKLRVAEKI